MNEPKRTEVTMELTKEEVDLLLRYEAMDDQDKLIISYLAERFAENPQSAKVR